MPSADGTTLGGSVASGGAWIEGFYYESDAPIAFTVTTAHATLARIDRVILRLDRTANTIAQAVLAGTAAASPVAPTLTQTDTLWELPLATVTVPAAAGVLVAGNVVDARVLTKNLNSTDADAAYALRAPNWVTARAYLVGELVISSGTLYRTITAHTSAGAFDATKFTAVGGAKTYRLAHTFTISGSIAVPSGETAYIPPFFISLPAGQTATIASARHRVHLGTSATWTVSHGTVDAGTSVTGLTAVASTTTVTLTAATAANTLADGDAVQLVVTAISGTPANMSVTVYLDVTV